jgi:hypothetical protein
MILKKSKSKSRQWRTTQSDSKNLTSGSLSLWGIFSYFPTHAPTNEQVDACDDVFLLTPNGIWNPHSDAYVKNEENMLDWEGNMVEKQD